MGSNYRKAALYFLLVVSVLGIAFVLDDLYNDFGPLAIENGTETILDPLDSLVTVGNSTVPTYLINNDTGKSVFTLTFIGTLASNAFLTCQVTGGSEACSITGTLGSVGTGGTYGPPSGQTTNWPFDVSLSFTGVPAGNFDLTFASFAQAGADTGTVSPTPEPPSLALLATGLFGSVGLAAWRKVRLTF